MSVANAKIVKAKRDVIMAVMLDTSLSPGTRLVGWLIADHVNTKRGYAWPSQEQIRKKLGLSVRHVRRAIHDLEKRGYFAVDKKERNHEYRIATPDKMSGVDTGHFRPKSRTSKAEKPDTACPPSFDNNVKSSASVLQEASNLDDRWNHAKKLLEDQVGPDRYHNWLKDLVVVDVGPNSVTLGSATMFRKRQVVEMFLPEIEKAWRQVDPAIAAVSIVVSGQEQTFR